jgi:hypothetical protein
MATLGQVVERIREDLNRGSDYDSRIKRAIAEAIRFYRNKRLGWNLKRAYATLTSGNEYVSLPSDWIEADLLRLDQEERRDVLTEVGYDWIDEENQYGLNRGRPTNYALQHRTLRFYPTPDQTYTLMFSFQYELKDVSVSASDGATNAWLDEGEELIRKHAESELLVHYIDGGDAIAKGQLLRQECSDQILPALESQAAREQSSGRIKAWI